MEFDTSDTAEFVQRVVGTFTRSILTVSRCKFSKALRIETKQPSADEFYEILELKVLILIGSSSENDCATPVLPKLRKLDRDFGVARIIGLPALSRIKAAEIASTKADIEQQSVLIDSVLVSAQFDGRVH